MLLTQVVFNRDAKLPAGSVVSHCSSSCYLISLSSLLFPSALVHQKSLQCLQVPRWPSLHSSMPLSWCAFVSSGLEHVFSLCLFLLLSLDSGWPAVLPR